MFRSLSILLSFIVLLTSSVGAQAQSLSDGVTVKTWKELKPSQYEYRDHSECPILPTVLRSKIEGGLNGQEPLTDAEFVSLVGDKRLLFGLQAGRQFYMRRSGRLEELIGAYATLQGIDTRDPTLVKDPVKFAAYQKIAQAVTPDSIPDDTPILCGDGSVEIEMRENQRKYRAQKAAEKREYERTCEVCTLPGGPLLQAIYDGDYDKQYDAALTYMSQLTIIGGRDTAAFGTIVTGLSKVGDITMLEDLIGSYMLYTSSKWDNQCYDAGAERIKFTREFADIVIQTYTGVELERFEGGSVTTEYKINPDFKEACDRLCNKHGAILMTGGIASGFSGPKTSVARTFMGLREFVNQHQCRSPEIERFEANLLSMWEQEKAAPPGTRRNSASEHFK